MSTTNHCTATPVATMKLVQKNHAFLLYYLTKNCWNFE